MTKAEFLYRLFFTKEDDIDLTQIIFLACVVYFFIVFALAGIGIMKVTVAAWSVFGTVFVTLTISGTPTNVARLIAGSKIGDVSRGISESESEPR